MGRTQTNVGSRYQVVRYPFHLSNFGNTNGTLLTQNTDMQTYWINRRGSIIGFSGTQSAALSTGTLTFQAVIDGSLCPAFTSILDLSNQVVSQTLDADTDNYLIKGSQSLGLRYTSSDTVTATTTDGMFEIEVLLQDINY